MTHFDFPMMLFLLVAAHALADYPLQGAFLANAKNRHTDLGREFWPHALLAHGLIHGGFVALITGSAALGYCEVFMHAVIDWLKCEGDIDLNTDQFAHIVCKVLWAFIALGVA